jgi:spermidine synthase
VIFTFQTFYGYLYHQIGLLIAIFMFGIALSSFYMTHRLERIKRDSFLFLNLEIAIILFSFLFPFIFVLPFQYLEKTIVSFLLYSVLLVMSFLSGTCIGLQFPLATKIYFSTSSKGGTLGYTAGLLYGADLMGGFLGGLFGGMLLLPILGLKESCFMIGMIKISSLVLLLLFMKSYKSP